MPPYRAEDWLNWQSRFSLEDAQNTLASFRVQPPLDSVLSPPEIHGIIPDMMTVSVTLREPAIPVRAMLWMVRDLDDLKRVVLGLVAFAALHEAQELLLFDGVPFVDPHGSSGDLVCFQEVMRRAGCAFWARE